MTSLEKIAAAAKIENPQFAPTSADWSRVELELGVTLAEDFKQLISSLGDGHFGNLHIMNPACPAPAGRFGPDVLQKYARGASAMERATKTTFWPKPGGLLLICTTNIALDLFLTRGENQRYEKIVVMDRQHKCAIQTSLLTSDLFWKLYSGNTDKRWMKELRKTAYDRPGRLIFTPFQP